MAFEVDIEFDTTVLDNICNVLDDDFYIYAYSTLQRYCEPYVPRETGGLSETVEISPECITYKSPYAHYQYVGEVMGPNCPIFDKGGNLAGFYSPKGQKKHYTGEQIQYSTEMSPLATKEWDQAMLRDNGEEYISELQEYIVERLKNG